MTPQLPVKIGQVDRCGYVLRAEPEPSFVLALCLPPKTATSIETAKRRPSFWSIGIKLLGGYILGSGAFKGRTIINRLICRRHICKRRHCPDTNPANRVRQKGGRDGPDSAACEPLEHIQHRNADLGVRIGYPRFRQCDIGGGGSLGGVPAGGV